MEHITVGDHVAWKWGQGIAEGVVEKVSPEPATITTKGKMVHRNGTEDDPALIIVSSKGTKVLKLLHEVQRTNKQGVVPVAKS